MNAAETARRLTTRQRKLLGDIERGTSAGAIARSYRNQTIEALVSARLVDRLDWRLTDEGRAVVKELQR